MYKNIQLLLTDNTKNKEVIKYADQICNHEFSFDKNWDMERCTIIYKLSELIDWNQIMNEDEEWTFMLNRMSYLKDLLIAYIISEDKKYADCCKNLVFQWINSHEQLIYSLSTRPLDSALRISEFYDVVLVLSQYNLLNREEKEIIVNSIVKQIEYIKKNYITKYRLSNWGSIQLLILCRILIGIDENVSNNKTYHWAIEELDIQMNIQILGDGMHWEQSTMYHVEVLNMLLKLIQHNQEIGNKYLDYAIKMVDALFNLTFPNGEIEAFGDSDRINTNDVFVKACCILNTNKWKIKEIDLDIDTIFDLGYENIIKYKGYSLNENYALNFDGYDSGLFMCSSNKKSDSNATMFFNGSLGSGHGHSDNLHLSLFYDGKFFLIDNGRYTYREDHTQRVKLKSLKSHNVVIIDDQPHSIPDGSWSNELFCKPIKTFYKHLEGIHYYEGGIVSQKYGYTQLRKLIAIDAGIWVIIDENIAQGKHKCKSYFHLDPCVEVDDDLVLSNGNSKLRMYGSGEYKIIRDKCSLRYNELEEQNVIVIENEFENSNCLVTELIGYDIKKSDVIIKQGDKILENSDIVFKQKYKINSIESYTVILFNEEIYKGSKIFECEGISFHAQSIVIKEINKVKTLYVLKY